ncbi:MAG: hypothetical protein Ta2D_04670 [Rickettsiales bacterium]|nr:MAG: hypothetical protein Ta2D_04670 [Rickettsiales bacterium]
MNTLEVKNIQKSYGTKLVLRNVNLEVKNGEVVGLLGPNGAGKTTLFYIIVGLIKANAGEIIYNNNNIITSPIYERARLGIGYLPQENSIFKGLSVEQNILAVLELKIKDKKEQVKKLLELLDEFSINHIRKSPALALSGGERRRVEIARAMATAPKILLLDEPFAGIDPIAVADIMKTIKHLKSKGISILITDHNVRETLGIVDKAYIVYDGTILTSGSPDEIKANEKVKSVYLGEDFVY